MPNWNAIAEKIARGMYGDQWAKEDAQKQELEAGKLRMELAKSGEGRAQEQQGWERKKQEEFEANRSTRDELARLGLSKAEQDVIIAQQNAAQETATTAEQPNVFKRAAETHARQGKELSLREREAAMREKDAADLRESRAVEREGGVLRNEAQRIQNAISDIDDPSLRVVLSNKQRELERLISVGASEDELAPAREELSALIDQYSANQRAVREARANARRKPGAGVLMNQGPASPYDIFK